MSEPRPLKLVALELDAIKCAEARAAADLATELRFISELEAESDAPPFPPETPPT